MIIMEWKLNNEYSVHFWIQTLRFIVVRINSLAMHRKMDDLITVDIN